MNKFDILPAVYRDELKEESVATRKCLERIPESTYSFKPHEKSMPLGTLALLVADIPNWITEMIRTASIDLATYKHPQLNTTEKILEVYDQNIQGAIEALATAGQEALERPFELKINGEVVWSLSTIDAISNTLNHWVHHRGQLTVYMRLNDIAVPSIYGPSADDKGMFAARPVIGGGK